MLIIGIDPGISGSICFFEDGKIVDVIDMPTMTEGKKNKKQVNGSQIYNEILKRINNLEKKDIKVVIEQAINKIITDFTTISARINKFTKEKSALDARPTA